MHFVLQATNALRPGNEATHSSVVCKLKSSVNFYNLPTNTHLLHAGPVLAAEVEWFDAQHPGNADDSHNHQKQLHIALWKRREERRRRRGRGERKREEERRRGRGERKRGEERRRGRGERKRGEERRRGRGERKREGKEKLESFSACVLKEEKGAQEEGGRKREKEENMSTSKCMYSRCSTNRLVAMATDIPGRR